MKEISFTTQFLEFEHLTDLPIDVQQLMDQAIEIRKKHTHRIQSSE